IAIKHALGKLKLPGEPAELVPAWMTRTGVTPLAVLHRHALHVATLPPHHRDPFDRMLVAQAQLEQLAILTADRQFARYEVTMKRA
ncbi:MAG TPA: type II toxin-antitoxin system VapC family toxin, partial [Gemmatimonadales bacterium]|nr:type II toxin-antitoxin system VapC family toxin [Gemmatimonadales bacterium]